MAKRSEDKQIKSLSGRVASFIGVFGLIGVHWLAIYEHSREAIEIRGLNNLIFEIIGIGLIFSAIVVNQIAVKTLGKFFDRLIIKEQHQLIVSGVYSLVRHPIYTSYLLLFFGFCTLLQSWISLGILTIICIIWFGNRIAISSLARRCAIEEKMLGEEFGEEYQKYRQQTKRFIPFLY